MSKVAEGQGGVRASKDHAHPYTTSLDKYDYNKTEHKAGNTAEGSLTDLALINQLTAVLPALHSVLF